MRALLPALLLAGCGLDNAVCAKRACDVSTFELEIDHVVGVVLVALACFGALEMRRFAADCVYCQGNSRFDLLYSRN